MNKNIVFEMVDLFSNLVSIPSDDCLDVILDSGVLQMLLDICFESRYGKAITNKALNVIFEFLSCFQCVDSKMM